MTRYAITRQNVLRGVFAAVFSVLGAGFSAALAADLITFAPPEGGFSVLLPSAPKMEHQKDAQADMHMWKLTGSPFGFVIAVGDYPAHLQGGPALDYYVANFLKGASGTVQSKQPVSFTQAPDGPLSAVDFVFSMKQADGESLVVVSGDRTYQIAVMYPKDYNGKDYAERILESFKITEPRKIWGGK